MKYTVLFYPICFIFSSCIGVLLWNTDAELREEHDRLVLFRDRSNRIQDHFTRSVPIGSIARPFELSSFEGQLVSFDPNNAKLSLLIFFNPTDCSWCLLEASLWREIHATYSQDEFTILGITTKNDVSASEVFMFKRGRRLDFPILRCVDRTLLDAFGITNTPTRILVDGSGRILDAGYSSHSKIQHERLKEKIALLLSTDLKEQAN